MFLFCISNFQQIFVKHFISLSSSCLKLIKNKLLNQKIFKIRELSLNLDVIWILDSFMTILRSCKVFFFYFILHMSLIHSILNKTHSHNRYESSKRVIFLSPTVQSKYHMLKAWPVYAGSLQKKVYIQNQYGLEFGYNISVC